VLFQICLVHVEGDTQGQICVKGILHWVKEEGGRITSMDRETREEGALSLDTFLFLEQSEAYCEELLLHHVSLY
jgi:hypothetical protein